MTEMITMEIKIMITNIDIQKIPSIISMVKVTSIMTEMLTVKTKLTNK